MKKKILRPKITIGELVKAEVFKITSFGAFVKFGENQKGFIHISQLSESFVKDINRYLKLGDTVKARVLNINGNKIDLTLKKPKEDTVSYGNAREFKSSLFEDKLNRFLEQKEDSFKVKEMDLSRGGAAR